MAGSSKRRAYDSLDSTNQPTTARQKASSITNGFLGHSSPQMISTLFAQNDGCKSKKRSSSSHHLLEGSTSSASESGTFNSSMDNERSVFFTDKNNLPQYTQPRSLVATSSRYLRTSRPFKGTQKKLPKELSFSPESEQVLNIGFDGLRFLPILKRGSKIERSC